MELEDRRLEVVHHQSLPLFHRPLQQLPQTVPGAYSPFDGASGHDAVVGLFGRDADALGDDDLKVVTIEVMVERFQNLPAAGLSSADSR